MLSTVMKRGMSYILMATLLVTSWVSVTSKPLSPNGASIPQVSPTVRIQNVPEPGSDLPQAIERTKGRYKEMFRGLSRLGSTPPRCEHKCGGCVPCVPIQIPTTKGIMGVKYANYEPEGWKCKCGTSYYNP